MNNPLQMIQAMRNPKDFLQSIMNNNQIMQNPVAKNAMDMWQRGDEQGLESMARNLCKENNINPDDVMKQVKSMFGM